jgi:hypothetical protein
MLMFFLNMAARLRSHDVAATAAAAARWIAAPTRHLHPQCITSTNADPPDEQRLSESSCTSVWSTSLSINERGDGLQATDITCDAITQFTTRETNQYFVLQKSPRSAGSLPLMPSIGNPDRRLLPGITR